MSASEPTLQLWRTQARYNSWMNDNLFESCASLTDEQRKRNLGAFFASIHGTLNHLLLADRVWLGRIRGEPFAVTSLDQELYGDFDTLRHERQLTDASLTRLVAEFGCDDLARVVSYRRISGGEAKALPLPVLMTHLFNHQIHHRGQLTTLLSQLGVDYGATDLIAMPGELL
ncbi:MAG: hypothetical protein VR73_14640 [Gammaproteobacteria bacterium BRH_c0]|nr:MAG: hypothetical protein VR73_14640 [Gammaproteobacteria bacterium BRH_c0]